MKEQIIKSRFNFTVWIICIISIMIVALIFLARFRTGDSEERHHPEYVRGANQMRAIISGLLNYHETWRVFPPSYVADKNGTPLHSWRALILPYIEQPILYDRYDFSEPWNGPNNSEISSSHPFVFSGPSGQTIYMLVVGKGCLWENGWAKRFEDIQDSPESVLAIVEVDNPGVDWLMPQDFPIENLDLSKSKDGLSSNNLQISTRYLYEKKHLRNRYCAVIATIDGDVRIIDDSTSPDVLRAMATINGGEKIGVKDEKSFIKEYILLDK